MKNLLMTTIAIFGFASITIAQMFELGVLITQAPDKFSQMEMKEGIPVLPMQQAMFTWLGSQVQIQT